MIALRGVLTKKPISEIQCARPKKDSKPPDEQVWYYEGLWAFGTIESPTRGGRGAIATSAKKPKPFYYSWIKPKRANEVPVPSLNFPKPSPEKLSSAPKLPFEEAPTMESTEEKSAVETNKAIDEAAGSVAPKPQESKPEEAPASDESAETKEASAVPMDTSSTEHQKVEALVPMDTDDAEKQVSTDQPSGAQDRVAEHQQNAKDAEVKQVEAPKLTEAAVATVAPTIKEVPVVPPTHARNTTHQEDQVALSTPVPEPPTTFAMLQGPDDPPYTEASTVGYDCPPDGEWTGHFENAVKRRYPVSEKNKIKETFTLFFNAKPPKDARVLFPANNIRKQSDAEEEKEEQDEGKLPKGHVHVRGMGTNQFGTFELIGSWNPETGTLECQKTYPANPYRSPRRQRSPKSKRINISPTDEELAASRHARKRQASWRKRESIEEEELRKAVASRQQKRQRPWAAPLAMAEEQTVADAMAEKQTAADAMTSTLNITIPPPQSAPLVSKRLSPKAAATGTTPAPRKGRASPVPKGGFTVPAPPPAQSTSSITLPSAGEPDLARWRAAHFLYYDNTIDTERAVSPTPGASASTPANFVVYEGEMLFNQREGRGVCLYNNNTIYEGEWRRNQEHGKGTLMSSDRKRIIYEGEWEKGRPHGKGKYYYSDLYTTEERPETRYEGDFKEGKRHGVGKYYLPDGSVYDGDWRDDTMTGHGVFKWPDGSVYDGSWKNNKRHGDGALRASDGFVYEGGWAFNAMEGRGTATYPNGQQYQGLWSNGRREGRGTIIFVNGATYEGRFRDDCMEGQGTMKITKNVMIPRQKRERDGDSQDDKSVDMEVDTDEEEKDDWMVPLFFQSDMGHIHRKAGFTIGGE